MMKILVSAWLKRVISLLVFASMIGPFIFYCNTQVAMDTTLAIYAGMAAVTWGSWLMYAFSAAIIIALGITEHVIIFSLAGAFLGMVIGMINDKIFPNNTITETQNKE